MKQQLTYKDLSPDQREAHDSIMTWLNRGTLTKPTLTLAGFAGTGKSSVVSVLAHELDAPAFCAFTGKASSVLGRKLGESGIATTNRAVKVDPETGERPIEPRPYCGTIHGLIYRPCDRCMVEEPEHPHTWGTQCRAEVEGLPVTKTAIQNVCLACDPPPPKRAMDGHCPRCGDGRFLRRDALDRAYGLIVVDEASMVTDDMLEDLMRYQVPILAVGDHGQLPPVRGTGSLMKHPDLRLEKIHRQAEGNPIIALSKRIRETGDVDDALEDGTHFEIVVRRKLSAHIGAHWTRERLEDDPLGSVMIAWTNKMRVNLNYDVREALGLKDQPPSAGDVVICLKNAPPVYNGMRGVIVGEPRRIPDPGAPKWAVSVNFIEDGHKAKDIVISEHQFFREKTIDYEEARAMGVSMARLGQLYDFGYGLTCHKMQGSQADVVTVIEEPGLFRMGPGDKTRWMYTAATRAANKLVWVR